MTKVYALIRTDWDGIALLVSIHATLASAEAAKEVILMYNKRILSVDIEEHDLTP